MRRSDIINGANEILTALNETKIIENLQNFSIAGRSTETTTALFRALKNYSIRYENFTPSAKEISTILKLGVLNHEGFWASITETKEAREARPVIYSLNQALEFLPKMLELLEYEVIQEFNKSSEKEGSKYKDKALLSVIISEPENRFSTPERLIEALESINLLYEVFAIVNNHNSNDLSVVACDSGSDKSFDFLGAAKIVESVKELIITLWDRVVFFREKKHHERLALIAESLPIIDYIGTLQNDKKLAPEQAEILKRKVLKGTEKFISSGAIIPEMEKESIHNPHLLMTPEPKLLVSAPKEVENTQPVKEKKSKKSESEEQEDGDLENLSAKELQLLKKLAGKMQSVSKKPKAAQAKRTARNKTTDKK